MEQMMQYTLFMVDEEPYCVWEWDLKERNMDFLKAIDHEYFEYRARCHFEDLESDDRHRAAVALRTAYYHGLETLFTLLCASVQAPDCVYGWVLKYSLRQLRNLVGKIISGSSEVFNKYGWDYVSWKRLARNVHAYSNADPSRAAETGELFGELWSRLSRDFLSQMNIDEYNGIKHGFRTHAGGFGLAAGIEKESGVPAPQENMKTLGYSEFGTSFLRAMAIGSLKSGGRNPNFRSTHCALNWIPESIVHCLVLISMSIGNTVSYLRIINGEAAKNVKFTRPQESEYFSKPWKKSVGVTNLQSDTEIVEEHIQAFTRQEIVRRLKGNK